MQSWRFVSYLDFFRRCTTESQQRESSCFLSSAWRAGWEEEQGKLELVVLFGGFPQPWLRLPYLPRPYQTQGRNLRNAAVPTKSRRRGCHRDKGQKAEILAKAWDICGHDSSDVIPSFSPQLLWQHACSVVCLWGSFRVSLSALGVITVTEAVGHWNN